MEVARGLIARELDWLYALGVRQITPIHLTNNASVSYTHLRAHETVLDLVCRLLLEKKKTQLIS